MNGMEDAFPFAYYDSSIESKSMDKLDYYTVMQYKAETDCRIRPYSASALCDGKCFKDGMFLQGGFILPLGDNRDNSQDGRYFGPVRMNKVIGRGIFRFWPIDGIKWL